MKEISKELLIEVENNDIEFKQEYVADMRKDVVAFANTDGGIVLVGVRKDGVIVGVEDADGIMLKISNSLHDAIAPDIMPFVRIQAIKKLEKYLVRVDVSTGINKPYYIKEKGLKPSGVYVRKGSSSQPLSDEGIRELIIESSGNSYESLRSLNQELTFNVLSEKMKQRNILFGEAQMRTLKLIGNDGLYTNLAYMLSDQFEIVVKAAVFQGTDKEVFRNRKEFSGSLLQQLEDIFAFIDLHNKTRAEFNGLIRSDIRDYPDEAIREALLNSIVHRDYSVGAANIINIYDDRIEFVSLGGLISGIDLDAIFLGVSRTRNPNLAAVFYRMGLIESYGTGIGKIRRSYNGLNKSPVFETAKGVFRVTLPNAYDGVNNEQCSLSVPKKHSLDKREQKIVDYAVKYGSITRKEAENLLQVGTTTAYKLLKRLSLDGVFKVQGIGKLSKYVLNK